MNVLRSLYFRHQGVEFLGTGSENQEVDGETAAQPNQSYCVEGIKPAPDLEIEIVCSSGGISKLDRYRVIGVTEVWFWEDGTLALYHLRANGYERIEQSELPGLENLDLDVLK